MLFQFLFVHLYAENKFKHGEASYQLRIQRKGEQPMRTERYIDMKSPLTGGRVKLVEDVEEQEFRKEKFLVHVRYCICEDTGEQFTIEGQDDFVLNQIYSQYRLNHGIPFTDEIIALRELYGLNYTQMSKILGFGANQWKQYEQGVVPSESNGKIIITIRSKACMLALLEASRGEFQEAEFAKVHASIQNAPEIAEKTIDQQLFYGKTLRGAYNGFSPMDTMKLQAMVCYLVAAEGGSVCPTKLNKEMFYADFLHFRRHSRSISGLQYRAIQYGPVPEHFDTIYDNVLGINKESVITFDSESIRLHLTAESDTSSLTEEEIATLADVSRLLHPMKTSEAVELSHAEPAWQHYEQQHAFIPYSEAYNLKAMF